MANKEEIKVISLINEGEYLNVTKDIIFPIYKGGNRVMFDINCSDKLILGYLKNSLVYTHGIRGIGKTKALIDLAKRYDFHILCNTLNQKNILKNDYDYEKVCTVNEARSRIQYKFVVDERFTIDEIKELRDKGINVVTGFINTLESNNKICDKNNKQSDENNESISTNELIGALNYEIKGLLVKLKKTRDNNDIGTYKNLVQALINVLNAKQSARENNYNNFEREKELEMLGRFKVN